MRIPFLSASEISHSVLRQQSGGSAGGKTAAKTCQQQRKAYTLFMRFSKR
jgi:hypothetical protein